MEGQYGEMKNKYESEASAKTAEEAAKKKYQLELQQAKDELDSEQKKDKTKKGLEIKDLHDQSKSQTMPKLVLKSPSVLWKTKLKT